MTSVLPWYRFLLRFAAVGVVLWTAACRAELSPVSLDNEPLVRTVSLEAPSPWDLDSLQRIRLDSLFAGYALSFAQPCRYDGPETEPWIDSVLATLSVDEKIGQLFLVDLPRGGGATVDLQRALDAVRTYEVGGFLIPRLLAPQEVYDVTRTLQEASPVPLLMAADYERGVGRFDNALTELPSNMAIGATRDPALAAAAGRLTALESRAVGVHLVLGPVVDVNNNPDNPIINIRSYGESPPLVGHMAAAFVREAEAYGVLTTLKHFPGHGNTAVDSHTRMGAVEGNRAELERIELYPYRFVLRRAFPASAIMTTHLWIQALDVEPLPATFSPRAVRGLLRQRLRFDGLVLTDDVKMGALHNTYSLQERVVEPLRAGTDIILTPEHLARSVEAVRDALKEGTLTGDELDAAVYRILRAKARVGLHVARTAPQEELDYYLEAPRGAVLAQQVADRAVTLLKSVPELPLRDTTSVLLVQVSNQEGSESIAAAMDTLASALGLGGTGADWRFEERSIPPARAGEVQQAARSHDLIVLALYLRLRAGRGEAGLYPEQDDLVHHLLAYDVPVVLVTFGNPYALLSFETADAHVVAYEQSLASVQAVARLLHGRQPPAGKLPITVGAYGYGSGLEAWP